MIPTDLFEQKPARIFPASPARISRKIQGPSRAARPIITPSAALLQRLQGLGGTIDVAIHEANADGQAHGLLTARPFRIRPRPRKVSRACGHARRDPAMRFAFGDAGDSTAIPAWWSQPVAHLGMAVRHAAAARPRRRESRPTSVSSRMSARSPRHTIARRLLGGAAEVDVDDLGAELDIHARRLRRHGGGRSRRSARCAARARRGGRAGGAT